MTSVLASLNTALHHAFADDKRVVLLGEDVLDPYGGAFKVPRGLSSAFPGRVLTTPVSEAGIVGVGAGLALRGLRPVVEIMFGDFVTLAADQLVNHVAKYRAMYNGQVQAPLVVRTPMGGRRGYGPTHSQTLEKLFLGVPGLRVLAPAALGDPGTLLYRAILESQDPVLFIENKLLYTLEVFEASLDKEMTLSVEEERAVDAGGSSVPGEFTAPTYRLQLRGAPQPAITLAAYGYMAELAQQAILRLAYEYELFAELVVPTQLSPFTVEAIVASTRQTRRLLTVEEGTHTMGWGAEVIALAAARLGQGLEQACRLGAKDSLIPASGPLEAAALPGVEDIVQAALAMS